MSPQEARRDHIEMLRFLGINAAFGAGLGVLFTLTLILFDIGGLGGYLGRAREPILPAIMIAAPMALTFAGAVAGSALMLMPYRARRRRALDRPSSFEALTRDIQNRHDEDRDHGGPK
ncbi:hypothetical protein [Rhizobium halophytocola]|uniref:Uncharacterized protein n=1 Tax=Rhizobium halophytocola TaxID=735519 RepID=A0ABS4E158_9HYPH|nr:hypothetical protein [Rhizobium halophytocola]MBP1851670.1 hypothetical protein [Rhizobium halophytocola]